MSQTNQFVTTTSTGGVADLLRPQTNAYTTTYSGGADFFGGGGATTTYATTTSGGGAYFGGAGAGAGGVDDITRVTRTTTQTTALPPTTQVSTNTEIVGGWDIAPGAPIITTTIGGAATSSAGGFFGDEGVGVKQTGDNPMISSVQPTGYVKEQITTVVEQVKKPILVTNELEDVYAAPNINVNKYLLQDELPVESFRYPETSPLCMIGVGLAVLGTLGSLLLMALLWKRDGRVLPFSHLALSAIALLCALFIGYVLWDSKRRVENGQDPNATLVAIALIMAILLACYFIASAIYLFMYRPFHYSQLASQNSDKTTWTTHFGAKTCQETWSQDRSWLNWVPLLGLLAGLGFLLAAICLWKLNRFPEQVARWVLGAACLAALLLALWALCNLYKARALYSSPALGCMNSGLLTALFWLLWLGVALLLLNLLWNIFKRRSGHFVFAIVMIIYLFVLVCVLGLVLRDMRQRQFSGLGVSPSTSGCTTSCAAILDAVHEEDIRSQCPNKYLPLGQTCTKSWMTSYWEGDQSPRFLNPACCAQVYSFYLWPLYLAGALSLLLILALLVAIAMNFYLSDKSEYLEFTDRKFGIGEIIFAVIALLALLLFIIFCVLRRSSFTVPRLNPNNITARAYSALNGATFNSGIAQDSNFELVNLNKVYNGVIPQDALIPFQLKAGEFLAPRALETVAGAALSAAGDAIADTASAAGNAISNTASAAGNVLSNTASAAGEVIGDAAASTANKAGSIFGSIKNSISNFFGGAKNVAANAASAAANTVADAAATTASTASNIANAAAGTVADATIGAASTASNIANAATNTAANTLASTIDIATPPTVLTALPATVVAAPQDLPVPVNILFSNATAGATVPTITTTTFEPTSTTLVAPTAILGAPTTVATAASTPIITTTTTPLATPIIDTTPIITTTSTPAITTSTTPIITTSTTPIITTSTTPIITTSTTPTITTTAIPEFPTPIATLTPAILPSDTTTTITTSTPAITTTTPAITTITTPATTTTTTSTTITTTDGGNATSLLGPATVITTTITNNTAVIASSTNGTTTFSPIIPDYAGSTPFAMRTANNIMTLQLNQDLCRDFKYCGFRFGVLGVNGKFSSLPFGSVGLGTPASRALYFNDTNAYNDFLSFCGTPEQLNALFAQLRITPYDVSAPTTVLFKGEQLNINELNGSCLRAGEAPPTLSLSPEGYTERNLTNFLIKGYSDNRSCYYNNTCVSDIRCFENNNMIVCKKGFTFYPSEGQVLVTIPLKVLDQNGNAVPYDEKTLVANSYYIYNGQKYYLKNAILNNGTLSFAVPRPINGQVDLRLSVYDSAGHYLPASNTFSIPPFSPPTYITPDLWLLTKDGRGCQGSIDSQLCFANKTLQYSNVEVQVVDSITGQRVGSLPLKLFNGLDAARFINTRTANLNGTAIFPNAAYDYYTVQFDGNGAYLPARTSFALQRDIDGDAVLYVTPRNNSTGIIDQYVSNIGTGLDKDLCMSIASYNGKECRVTATSKYCGYSEYIQDVPLQKDGYEKIRVNNFTVSHYLTYLCNAATYSGTCAALENPCTYLDNQNTLRSLDFNWGKVRKLDTGAAFRTLNCFTGWGFNTLRAYRIDTDIEPSARICQPFYPEGSFWSVSNLKRLNGW